MKNRNIWKILSPEFNIVLVHGKEQNSAETEHWNWRNKSQPVRTSSGPGLDWRSNRRVGWPPKTIPSHGAAYRKIKISGLFPHTLSRWLHKMIESSWPRLMTGTVPWTGGTLSQKGRHFICIILERRLIFWFSSFQIFRATRLSVDSSTTGVYNEGKRNGKNSSVKNGHKDEKVFSRTPTTVTYRVFCLTKKTLI